MDVKALAIPDVLLLEPRIFSDARGYFYESFNTRRFSEIIGKELTFVQDNCSYSKQGVLRGLHYQIERPQAKLVSVVHGEVFDVAVDIRPKSATFGQWVGEILSGDNKRQLWIPEGFAHGYLVLSKEAVFQYKVSEYWYPEYERCLCFDDKRIAIQWPHLAVELSLSMKDRQGHRLDEITQECLTLDA
jgi:dTDP-4-dehydrorhamnose 3,5-epimerase